MLEPIIKWSGSKRSQAEAIVARMPRKIGTYYEPFCGGASVLCRLLNTPSVKVDRFIISDLNQDLINLWIAIRDRPEELIGHYESFWKGFNRDIGNKNECETRKLIFEIVRDSYNRKHSPEDFLCIMRTTTNGMPRYNKEGIFNNSCHFSRPGITPLALEKICREWSAVLRSRNVQFVCQSYEAVADGSTDADSLIYMDPPYSSVKKNQMYNGGIDMDAFFSWLRTLKGKWILSFDGKRGEQDYSYAIPKDVYVRHEYLNSGNSSFERYLGQGRIESVYESLYMNYEPAICHPQIQETFL